MWVRIHSNLAQVAVTKNHVSLLLVLKIIETMTFLPSTFPLFMCILWRPWFSWDVLGVNWAVSNMAANRGFFLNYSSLESRLLTLVFLRLSHNFFIEECYCRQQQSSTLFQLNFGQGGDSWNENPLANNKCVTLKTHLGCQSLSTITSF